MKKSDTPHKDQSALLKFASDATFAIDLEGRITLWNRAAEEFTGVKAEDMLGKGDYEYSIPFYGVRRPILIDMVLSPSEEIERLYPHVKREDGVVICENYTRSIHQRGEAYMLAKAAPIYDSSGNIIGAIESVRDITKRKKMEEALLDGEQKLNSIIYGSPIPQFAIDREHRVIYWNKALEEISGIRAKEIIGTRQQWRAFYSAERPCMADLLMDGSEETIAGWYRGKWSKSKIVADAYEAEDYFPALGKDGKWLYFTAAVIKDSKGKVTGAVETLEDITERKRAEEALQKTNEMLRALIQASPLTIVACDMNGNITMWNPAAERMFGWPASEILGLPNPLCPKEEFQEFCKRMNGSAIFDNFELVLHKRDGLPVEVSLSTAPLRDVSGNNAGVMAILSDIAQRKEAERDLRLSNEKFSKVFDHSPERISISSLATGRYIDVNAAFLRYTGYSLAEVIGKTSLELSIWFDPEERNEIVTVLHDRGKIYNREVKFYTKTGDVQTMLWSAELIEYGGETCILAITRDITGLKRVEEELRLQVDSLKQHLLSDRLEHEEAFSSIITGDKKMRAIFQYMEVVAGSQQPVLITGETGVGKELVARTIHALSGRKGAFVPVNVAGLDDAMFSDTLFGHRRGAYTSADRVREGLIAQASGGTLFLDEIGDMSELSQAKLLRLLQEETYYPLGSDVHQRTDARIVFATNKDFQELILTGKFRKDLYYRICAHKIHVPPLREKLDDMSLLVDHFLGEASQSLNKKKPALSAELIDFLTAYSFPGNIRELRAMVYDAVARHISGQLSRESFGGFIGPDNVSSPAVRITSSENGAVSFDNFPCFPTLKKADDYLISEAMRRSNGNQRIAASYLGITRQALNKRLHKDKQL
jgi:PAS domain S-box-containing protein